MIEVDDEIRGLQSVSILYEQKEQGDTFDPCAFVYNLRVSEKWHRSIGWLNE